MWKAALKGVFAHKLRLALTGLSIVLGVGFVSGSFVFTDTLNSVFDDLFAEAFAGIDVEITADVDPDLGRFSQPERMPATLLEEVRRVDGVKQAAGNIFAPVQLIDMEGEPIRTQGAPTFGGSWPALSNETGFVIRQGREPRGESEAVLDAASAEKFRVSLEDEITVIALGEPQAFEVVGIAGFGEADSLAGATFALFHLSVAQRIFNAGGTFDTIDVLGEEGLSDEDLARRISEILPEGFVARTAQSAAEEQASGIREGLGFFNTFLLVFAGIALFVGAFNIQNTFRIIVTQRTRELALLRAVGATSRQVTTMVVVEALVVAVVASGLGVVAGLGLAVGLEGILEATGGQLPDAPLKLLPRTVIVSLLVGVVVTVASAVLPARRASRVPPVAAIRDQEPTGGRSLRGRLIAGIAVTAVGLGLLAVGLFVAFPEGAPPPIAAVGLGAAVIFIGVSVVSPLFAQPLGRLLGRPFLVKRLEGTLARENSVRSPRRTAATAASLMIGMALVTLATILAASVQRTTTRVIDETFRWDLTVATTEFVEFGFSPEIADRVEKLDETELVMRERRGLMLLEGERASVLGVEPEKVMELFDLEIVEGRLEDLGEGRIALRADEAEELGVRVGDEVEVLFARTGPQKLEVAALKESGARLISLDTFRRHFIEEFDSGVFIRLAPGVSLEEGRRVVSETIADFPTVEVRDLADFRAQAESQINQLLGLIFGLLALAVIIAIFGITSTLSLSILERTREIGLLRAVGMSRRQIRRIIRWEAVIVALFGGVVGLFIGILFGWAVVEALSGEGLRDFVVPVGRLVAWLAAAAVAGILAAVTPAWRASRLNVLEAIAYE